MFYVKGKTCGGERAKKLKNEKSRSMMRARINTEGDGIKANGNNMVNLGSL